MAGPELVVRVAATLDQLRANLAEGTNQIETTKAALQRMASSYDGSKIIAQAGATAKAIQDIGGASKLTADEQARANAVIEAGIEKYKALGKDVPPGMQVIADATKKTASTFGGFKETVLEVAGALGVAFSVAAVVQWGKATFDSIVQGAGALVDLNAKTGVSIEQLQRFAFVGKQANVSVDDFAQASFKLGVNLSGGSGSVRQAVIDLGLSYEKLRAQTPDQQFNATIAALERMVDPQERNRIAVELFGKSFSTIAPAVAKGYTEMAKQAQVSSEAQVKAIDDASDAWDRWVAKQKTSITSSLGNMLLLRAAVDKLPEGFATFLLQTDKSIKTTDDLSAAMIRWATTTDVVIPSVNKTVDEAAQYAEALAKAQAELSRLTGAQVQGITSALLLGDAHDKIAVKFHLSDQALALFIDRQKKATEAEREADAIAMTAYERRIRSLETQTQATLKAYSFEGQIEQLHALSAAEDELARHVYDQLTSEKDRAKVIEDMTARHIAEKQQEIAINLKEQALSLAGVKEATEAQIAYNRSLGMNAAGLVDIDPKLDAYLQRLRDIAAMHTTVAAKTTLTEIATANWMKSMQDAAIEAEHLARAARGENDIYKELNETALLSNDEWLNKLIEDHRRLAPAINATTAAQQAARSAFGIDPSSLSPEIGGTRGAPGSYQYEAWQNLQGIFTRNNPPPMRDAGGPVSAGQSYYIGTGAQPELFTPKSDGYMTPKGAGGATYITNVYVTQPLGTPQAIARAVDDALTRRLSGTGVRM